LKRVELLEFYVYDFTYTSEAPEVFLPPIQNVFLRLPVKWRSRDDLGRGGSFLQAVLAEGVNLS
jgi:hypothetical protein